MEIQQNITYLEKKEGGNLWRNPFGNAPRKRFYACFSKKGGATYGGIHLEMHPASVFTHVSRDKGRVTYGGIHLEIRLASVCAHISREKGG